MSRKFNKVVTPRRSTCSTALVRSLDALGKPRDRCPTCRGVARRAVARATPPPDLDEPTRVSPFAINGD